MLNILRKNAGSWMIKVLLFAIVAVFIFWGVGTFREQRGGRIAVVNGQTITYNEYLKTYNLLIENLKQRFGNNLSDDVLKMFNVKNEALEQLINNKLLLEEANRLRFRVSKEELSSSIREMQAFHNNGSFDPKIYRRVLEYYRRTPEEFEALQKEAMLIDKLRTFVNNSAKVSDEEALLWYQWNHASVDIDFVLFEPGKYKEINPSQKEIAAYFESNKESYKTQPMLKARYLRFDPKEYESKAKVSDEDVINYFDENSAEFITPKTVEAKHILLKVPPDADTGVVEEKRKKAEEIAKSAKQGKDFAELARAFSEDASKTSGGYLGAFKKQDMVAPFADKAFSMKPGDISDPVRTEFGWHIIKVEKVNEESRKKFLDVEKDIRKKLMTKASESMAQNQAESVYDESFDNDDLKKIADLKNLELLTTDFFTKTGPIADISQGSEFAAAAFELEPMEISEVKKIANQYYVIQVMERMPEKIPELKNIESNVRNDLTKKLQEEKAKKDADDLMAQLKANTSLTDTKKNEQKFKSSGFFTRYDEIPNIGYEKDISQAAFMLSKENPCPKNAVKGSKGYYAIIFKERKAPEMEGFEKEKANIKENLLQRKQVKLLDTMVKGLRKNSDVSIKEGFI